MTNPYTPLSKAEFNELEQFLLYDVDTEGGMTLDMADGFLHAIAVGPTTTHPKQWLPKIWGTSEMMPPMDSIEQLNHILGLVMRHFNSIIAGLRLAFQVQGVKVDAFRAGSTLRTSIWPAFAERRRRHRRRRNTAGSIPTPSSGATCPRMACS